VFLTKPELNFHGDVNLSGFGGFEGACRRFLLGDG